MIKIHDSSLLIADRYFIERFYAEGGMQEVYLATDRHLDRPVALKTPKTSSASKRFQSSSICSAKIIHPNVARTLDYFVSDGREYLVEEFIEGDDLQKIFNTFFDYLDPSLVAHIGHLLVRGLLASHRANIVHRDLKPSNIMICGGISVSDLKITDFGIAKLLDDELKLFSEDDVESSVAGSRTLVGAVPYMAPEIVLDTGRASKSSDIWSFGAILYQLLSGKAPFGTKFTKIILNYHLKKPIEPINILHSAQHLSPLAAELFQIIIECLDYDENARPTAEELLKRFSGLCYSNSVRKIGVVKYRDKGYGFMSTNDCDEDIFFHSNDTYGEALKIGDNVSFSAYDGVPKSRAFPTVKLRS